MIRALTFCLVFSLLPAFLLADAAFARSGKKRSGGSNRDSSSRNSSSGNSSSRGSSGKNSRTGTTEESTTRTRTRSSRREADSSRARRSAPSPERAESVVTIRSKSQGRLRSTGPTLRPPAPDRKAASPARSTPSRRAAAAVPERTGFRDLRRAGTTSPTADRTRRPPARFGFRPGHRPPEPVTRPAKTGSGDDWKQGLTRPPSRDWTQGLIREKPPAARPPTYGTGPLGDGSWDLGAGSWHFGPPVRVRPHRPATYPCSTWRPYPCGDAYGHPWGVRGGGCSCYGTQTVYVWPEPEVYVETVYVDQAREAELGVPLPVEPLANAPAVPEIEEPGAPAGAGIAPLDEASERFLSEGSEAFIAKRYADAAEAFRRAVAANPGRAEPKFALGQALIGMGEWDDAANVLRSALVQEPDILSAPGSIVDVYESPEEFYTVLSRLKSDLVKAPKDANRLFLLVYQYHFSDDPAAVPWFARLAGANPEDPTRKLLQPALQERFPGLQIR